MDLVPFLQKMNVLDMDLYGLMDIEFLKWTILKVSLHMLSKVLRNQLAKLSD